MVPQTRLLRFLVIAPLLALVVDGCGSYQIPMQAIGPEPGVTAVVYWVPGADTKGEGTIYVRQVDSVTLHQVAGDRLIARGTDFWPVGTHSSPPPVAWEVAVTTGSGTQGFPVNISGTQAPAWADASADRRITAIAPDGTVAFAPLGKGVVTLAPSGAVRNYALPPVQTGDGSAFKGPAVGGPLGAAGAILFAPNGDLLAGEYNGVNSELVDLTIGRRLDLLGYSYVESMAVGPDGSVYVLAWDERLSSNPYVFLVVDGASWTVKGVVTTPIKPHEGFAPVGPLSIESNNSALFLYAAYGSYAPGILPHQLLLRLEYGTSAVSEIQLPDGLGLQMQAGSDGHLRFFGGPAQDRVTPYDPSTGLFGQATGPAQLAPAGADIGAVFS